MAFPTQSIDLEASSSQYASITDASQTGLDFSNAMTLEAWIKLESLPSGGLNYAIMTKRLNAGAQRSYDFRYQDNGGTLQIACDWFHDGNNTGGTAASNWVASTGVWYHVAFTKTGTTAMFFVNGVQQGATYTGSNATVFNSTAPFYVGAVSLEDGRYFDGRIVLARAWAVARTQNEINAAKCTILGSTTNLSAEWTLDNTYNDNSGNSNTLTGNNSPTFGADVPTAPCTGIILDAITVSGVQTDKTTYSFNHPTGAAANRMEVVVEERNNASDTIDAITYNGDALTAMTSSDVSTGAYRIRKYFIDSPDVGTNSFSITWSGNVDALYITISTLSNANPGQPEAIQTATGTGTTASANITTIAANAWLMSAVNRDFDNVGDTWVPATGQQQFSNSTAAANQILVATGQEQIVTPGAQTDSWTLNDSAAWAISVHSTAPLQAAAANSNFLMFMNP